MDSSALPDPPGSVNEAEVESFLLPADQAELIETFRKDVRLCESDAGKFRLCSQMRNWLLVQHTQVELLIALFERVMLAECPDYRSYKKKKAKPEKTQFDAEEWDRFIGVAASGSDMITKCLPHLKAVSFRWGRDRLQHYNWPSRGWKFCKTLGAVANKMGWPEFVIKGNQLLLRRAQMDGKFRSHRIRDSPDPLNLVELRNLVKWTGEVPYTKDKDPQNVSLPFREIFVEDLPTGYGFDEHGLMIRRPSEPLMGAVSEDSRLDTTVEKITDSTLAEENVGSSITVLPPLCPLLLKSGPGSPQSVRTTYLHVVIAMPKTPGYLKINYPGRFFAHEGNKARMAEHPQMVPKMLINTLRMVRRP
ncbi:hypothetical protein HRG_001305 [Hirsutella rhossiliensis]|uniref:Uncharacterized protein n=1 Tax=Hirsutella rhossiliensis TaxID=111463 RepID=A0A9P8N559_9HYPO|nr:uncharacterized protein HRG_01305 [Hirsutella rhossiliensis]KAH0968663.1 hypothetical protein HRG_01305 [Hirsutella rhossiliensis]